MLQLSDLNGLVTVDKEIALHIKAITSDKYQRVKDTKRVSKLATMMILGQWQDRGETVVISSEGARLDGNHRLDAVIEADVEVQLRFINDVPEVQKDKEIFVFIDSATRKPYDVLSVEHKNLNHIKEVTSLVAQLEAFSVMGLYERPAGIKLTNQSVLALADKHRPLATLDIMAERGINLSDRSGTLKGKTIRNKLISAKEGILLAATIDTCEFGNKFVEELSGLQLIEGVVIHRKGGHSLDPTDPLARCVVQLHNITNSDAKQKQAKKYAVIFDAYNYYVQGINSTDKKLIISRIIYPEDYDKYTDV